MKSTWLNRLFFVLYVVCFLLILIIGFSEGGRQYSYYSGYSYDFGKALLVVLLSLGVLEVVRFTVRYIAYGKVVFPSILIVFFNYFKKSFGQEGASDGSNYANREQIWKLMFVELEQKVFLSPILHGSVSPIGEQLICGYHYYKHIMDNDELGEALLKCMSEGGISKDKVVKLTQDTYNAFSIKRALQYLETFHPNLVKEKEGTSFGERFRTDGLTFYQQDFAEKIKQSPDSIIRYFFTEVNNEIGELLLQYNNFKNNRDSLRGDFDRMFSYKSKKTIQSKCATLLNEIEKIKAFTGSNKCLLLLEYIQYTYNLSHLSENYSKDYLYGWLVSTKELLLILTWVGFFIGAYVGYYEDMIDLLKENNYDTKIKHKNIKVRFVDVSLYDEMTKGVDGLVKVMHECAPNISF